ncbi:3-phosphoshikimate 1-carboxyvinyltransferase [Clostridium sp. DL1XJH146]
MKKVKIIPSSLSGEVIVPPSKSLAHRAIIAASLAKGKSRIDNINFSNDITVTKDVMINLGAKVDINGDIVEVDGKNTFNIDEDVTCFCGESGSTIRFLIPISLLSKKEASFTGEGKLVSRPLDVYYKIFDEKNIKYKNNNGELPLKIKGELSPGEYSLRGDVSSQFITGLLFTLPLLNGDSKIIITTKLESVGYIDLTLDILNKFGIEIINNEYREFIIKGNQEYVEKDYRVEGDFSQAAFWIVAGIIGSEIDLKDINKDSLQGDKAILHIVKEMKGTLKDTDNGIKACPSDTKAAVIDVSQCPDLVPVLAVMAALSEGETRIINAARLRIKESDRLASTTTELKKIGAEIEELEDSLVIRGVKSFTGGEVDSWNDHRIAMAMAVASIRCTEPLIINNSGAVKKSYPHFWEDFKKLGGNIDEWSVGQ